MLRMHVMLRVRDLDDSTRFYSELFGSEPTVQRSDYAKWMLEDPRLNFSIAVKPGKPGAAGIEHLGLQAEDPAELETLRGRIGRAGGTVTNEGETTCCYANSDKTWVVDAQGVAWEAFYTHGTSPTYYAADAGAGTCCADSCCDGDDTSDVAAACCASTCCASDGTSATAAAT